MVAQASLLQTEHSMKGETPSLSASFNFGPASTRDTILFTAERPGNSSTTTTGVADVAKVQEWIAFMKQQGIANVIVLLDDNELTMYHDPDLLQRYKIAGFEFLVQPMNGQNACQTIMAFILRAESKNERVVAHCTGGVGRASRVAACWLMKR